MKYRFHFKSLMKSIFFTASICIGLISCNPAPQQALTEVSEIPEKPDYFIFRPEVEKAYGYTHAVKIGNHIKISGAVSMDEKGILVAPGNMEQQMRNCYSDLEKILAHYGCTFEDVYAENIYTTDMAGLEKVLGVRSEIYKNHFPTGTWLEVKGLALPGQLIEIDMEALK